MSRYDEIISELADLDSEEAIINVANEKRKADYRKEKRDFIIKRQALNKELREEIEKDPIKSRKLQGVALGKKEEK